jgi:hypothetical protein
MAKKPNPIDILRDSIASALTAFASNRTRLLQEAYDNGSLSAVNELTEEYNMLLAADYELIGRQLQENDPAYVALTDDGIALAKDLEATIKQVGQYAATLTKISKAIDLIGRIIIKLGA